ncbi:protein of unknown function [Bradyrhizobium vignae]|uniref:Uncharacterized protein n=1 Tax=Bradyrhizobium vignae TaxID=1549949 RepID=A0A2U3Q105_9BRAD|nr:protein of unknown function [Bradyrhizobium vignae]
MPVSTTNRSGFLESRVYAKLQMPWLLERYQSFNEHLWMRRRPAQNTEDYEIGKRFNICASRRPCRRIGKDDAC